MRSYIWCFDLAADLASTLDFHGCSEDTKGNRICAISCCLVDLMYPSSGKTPILKKLELVKEHLGIIGRREQEIFKRAPDDAGLLFQYHVKIKTEFAGIFEQIKEELETNATLKTSPAKLSEIAWESIFESLPRSEKFRIIASQRSIVEATIMEKMKYLAGKS